MKEKKSIVTALALLIALCVTVVTFASQSDQGHKAFDGQTNSQQNTNTTNKKKGKSNSNTTNSNSTMNSNMDMNSNTNTPPNTNGTPK